MSLPVIIRQRPEDAEALLSIVHLAYEARTLREWFPLQKNSGSGLHAAVSLSWPNGNKQLRAKHQG